MAQNFNLGTLGQVLTVNTAANTTTYVSALVVGNSSVNVVVNSSSVYVNGSPLGGATNTAAQYTWSNTQTFQNTITFSSTINGTANNSLYLGGIAAASYVNTSQLSSNLSGYQTTAGLSANVATLTSNNSTYAFGKSEVALNVNSALTSNNSSYLGGTAASGYQTTAGLSANVATLTSNNTSFVGSVSAANVVSNAQLSANLANYAPLGGATFTGAVVVSNNLTVTGNLTLSGNTVIVGANNLVVQDAVFSLHTLANLAPWTSNDGKLIGTAYHYYDTSDKQALLVVNPSNTFLTYYNTSTDAALGDPSGTTLGTIQANTFYAGNSSVYATVNATTYTGSANNASYLGGVAAASYVNTSAAYTITGVHTYNSNVVIGTTAGISANGSYGTANQVLTSNGTSVYWSTVSSGGSGGTTSQQQYTGDGTTTVFTFTGGYTANKLQVYLNGVLLRNGTEVTVTSGSTFTITPAPVSGDLIDAIAFSNINSSGASTVVSQQFTANGTANSFTVTGGYIPSNIQVYLNGVKQIPGTDVVITSGNTVNFAVTPANTYIVDVYGYQNAVTLTSNTLTVSGTLTTNAISANGTVGSNGQVLTSNGSASYWATLSLTPTSITYGTSNVSIASSGGNITLATAGAAAVTVDTSQNVGIGTSSPSYNLEVYGSGAFLGGITRATTSTDAGAIFSFSTLNASSAKTAMADVLGASSTTTAGAEAGYMSLRTKTSGSMTEKFRIGSAGQLGIGGATYGTSGQVLTSGGSGAAPSWATPAAGSLTLLATLTTTSGTTQVASSLPTTYKNLSIVLIGVNNSSGNDSLNLEGSSDNGSNWGSNLISINNSGGVTVPVYGNQFVFAVNTNTTTHPSQSRNLYPGPYQYLGTTTAAPINALRFSWGSGATFNAGTIYIYGWN